MVVILIVVVVVVAAVSGGFAYFKMWKESLKQKDGKEKPKWKYFYKYLRVVNYSIIIIIIIIIISILLPFIQHINSICFFLICSIAFFSSFVETIF